MENQSIREFGSITLIPDFQVNGEGKNVDSIDFWEAPNATNTLMFVTAKGNSCVEVWKYPFRQNEMAPLKHPTFENSQVNGVIVDQEENLLYIAVSKPSNTVSVFRLPELEFVMNFNKPGVNLGSEPNLALLKLSNGDKRLYVSSSSTVYIHDAATGEFLNEFKPVKGLETMFADNYHQIIYIPDENGRTGIYAYHPDGTAFEKDGKRKFGEDVFQSDAEGIWVYPLKDNHQDTGAGFIIVSDQRKTQTDFEVFDRESWQHLGTFGLDGVSNTDGICSFPAELPEYPLGIFAAINDDSTTAEIGWDKILKEINKAAR